mmetsp:Transcript_80461/g.173937  ORF Transcript_80461/g.173937 Transcript_80461/m.173937 type:complete len:126 (-) Transcript_80461:217-594(-)
MRALKHLESHIEISVVHPTWVRTKPESDSDLHCGWTFRHPGDNALSNPLGHGAFECDDALIPDPVMNAKFIRDIYEANGDTLKKYSVPILFDKKTNKIVNNESSDIIRMLNTEFDGLIDDSEKID